MMPEEILLDDDLISRWAKDYVFAFRNYYYRKDLWNCIYSHALGEYSEDVWDKILADIKLQKEMFKVCNLRSKVSA